MNFLCSRRSRVGALSGVISNPEVDGSIPPRGISGLTFYHNCDGCSPAWHSRHTYGERVSLLPSKQFFGVRVPVRVASSVCSIVVSTSRCGLVSTKMHLRDILGSNPSTRKYLIVLLAQWIRRLSSEQKIQGSSPWQDYLTIWPSG
jgi:hypothetical protein